MVKNELSLTVTESLDTTDLGNRFAAMKEQQKLIQAFFKEVMVPNQDYGIIPGTDKPCLLKSGAEKMCEFYGYAPLLKEVKDEYSEDGHLDVTVTMQLVSKRTGDVIAEGIGMCSSRESKYAYRWVFEDDVPAHLDKNVLKKQQKKSRKTGKPFIMYQVPNEDLPSIWNTVVKMAKKRAFVDVALSATRSSGLFTQDMEEMQNWAKAIDVEFVTEEKRPTPQPKTSPKFKPAAAKPTVLESKALQDLYKTAQEVDIKPASLQNMAKVRFGKTLEQLNDQEVESILKSVITIGSILDAGYSKQELARLALDQCSKPLLDLTEDEIEGLKSYIDNLGQSLEEIGADIDREPEELPE